VVLQVPLNEYEFPTAKVANVQSELQRLVEKNYYLNQAAKDAFRGYVLAYNSHSLKDIFNVHALDLAAVARSFGFDKPPRVRLTACLPLTRLCGTLTRIHSHAYTLRPHCSLSTPVPLLTAASQCLCRCRSTKHTTRNTRAVAGEPQHREQGQALKEEGLASKLQD
jgi:hypothetical protein